MLGMDEDLIQAVLDSKNSTTFQNRDFRQEKASKRAKMAPTSTSTGERGESGADSFACRLAPTTSAPDPASQFSLFLMGFYIGSIRCTVHDIQCYVSK